MSVIQVHLEVHHNENGEHEVLASFKEGDVGILTRFTFQAYTEFARQLLDKGFQALDSAVQNPPKVLVPVAETSSAKTSSTSSKKAASPKPEKKKESKVPNGPFVLFQEGKRRSIRMQDDFELQERCMKNLALEFKKLDEAIELAKILASTSEKEVEIHAGKQQEAILKILVDGSEIPVAEDETEDLSEAEETEASQDTENEEEEANPSQEDLFGQLLEDDEFELES